MTKKQYIELNIRIQKSLILDFDLPSAQQSALEDWKIDVEREMIDKQDQGIIDPAQNLGSQESSLDNEGEDGEVGSQGDPNRSIIQQQKKN